MTRDYDVTVAGLPEVLGGPVSTLIYTADDDTPEADVLETVERIVRDAAKLKGEKLKARSLKVTCTVRDS